MSHIKIEVGDTVTVYFNHSTMLRGIVYHIPQATGECWILAEVSTKMVAYVQQFDYMIADKKDDYHA